MRKLRALTIFNSCFAGFNIVVGARAVFWHLPWKVVALNFGAAAFIIANSAAAYYWRRRQDRAMAELTRLRNHEMVEGERGMDSETAFGNLTKVLKAVGGRWDEFQGCALVDEFMIGPSNIVLPKQGIHTCYESAGSIPAFERIATAALLLHRNPQLFWYWRNHQGQWKA